MGKEGIRRAQHLVRSLLKPPVPEASVDACAGTLTLGRGLGW